LAFEPACGVRFDFGDFVVRLSNMMSRVPKIYECVTLLRSAWPCISAVAD